MNEPQGFEINGWGKETQRPSPCPTPHPRSTKPNRRPSSWLVHITGALHYLPAIVAVLLLLILGQVWANLPDRLSLERPRVQESTSRPR